MTNHAGAEWSRLTRDDRRALAGSLLLLFLAGTSVLIAQHGLALAEASFSVLIMVSAAVEIGLRRLDTRSNRRVPMDVMFRSAMSCALGLAAFALAAYLAWKSPPIVDIGSSIGVVSAVLLGLFFVFAGWTAFRAGRSGASQ